MLDYTLYSLALLGDRTNMGRAGNKELESSCIRDGAKLGLELMRGLQG